MVNSDYELTPLVITPANTDEIHTAAGQMAGYLFQPDRALLLLCSCKSNESVGIEFVDDLSIIDETGTVTLREQDKSSIRINGKTFQDRSKDLWNTLAIWTQAIDNKTLDINKVKLICVTNKKLSEKSIIKKISSIVSDQDLDTVITLLKEVGKNPSIGLKPFTEIVLRDETVLKNLIKTIQVVDGQSLTVRTDELADKMMLSSSYKGEVIEDLRGWLQTIILTQFDKGESPIISKASLIRAKDRIVQRHLDLRVKVQAKRYIQITDDQKHETIDKTFVKQLELINHPMIDVYIANAIEDFLCAETESLRLTMIGDLTKPDFLDMEERSRERWNEIFMSHMHKVKSGMTKEELGDIAFQIYDTTIQGYTARLGNYETEPYFTKGSYHRLSDGLEIGWHPDWKNKFSAL